MNVTMQRDGGVATVLLDRPEAGNRLDAATLDALREHLGALAGPGGPAVVVLCASGPDFCLGRQAAPPAGPPTPSAIEAEFARVQAVNELVQRCPAVTVAAVRGQVRGAGLSLAGRCDFVVAGEGARLSFPEVSDAIPPTIVLSHYRYVLAPKVLADLVFTGREITAAEGVTAGLVSRVVPDDEVDGAAMALAREVAAQDERTLRVVKRFLADTEAMDPRAAPAHGIAVFAGEMVDRALQGGRERDG